MCLLLLTRNDQIHSVVAWRDPVCLEHDLGLGVCSMPWAEDVIQQFIQLQPAARRATSDITNQIRGQRARHCHRHERQEVSENAHGLTSEKPLIPIYVSRGHRARCTCKETR
jgi:hypothetical protein